MSETNVIRRSGDYVDPGKSFMRNCYVDGSSGTFRHPDADTGDGVYLQVADMAIIPRSKWEDRHVQAINRAINHLKSLRDSMADPRERDGVTRGIEVLCGFGK